MFVMCVKSLSPWVWRPSTVDRVLSACVGCASGKASFKRLQRWTLAEGRTVTATAKALHWAEKCTEISFGLHPTQHLTCVHNSEPTSRYQEDRLHLSQSHDASIRDCHPEPHCSVSSKYLYQALLYIAMAIIATMGFLHFGMSNCFSLFFHVWTASVALSGWWCGKWHSQWKQHTYEVQLLRKSQRKVNPLAYWLLQSSQQPQGFKIPMDFYT